jgi:hypothetical protein
MSYAQQWPTQCRGGPKESRRIGSPDWPGRASPRN